VSNRTRSKPDYKDQDVGGRPWSTMQYISNLSFQNFFFTLHDGILFEGHGNFQAQDLQLRVVKCKVYHNTYINTKYQFDFDRFLQLHMLDNNEEDKYMSQERC
jgi:hypothetical protein